MGSCTLQNRLSRGDTNLFFEYGSRRRALKVDFRGGSPVVLVLKSNGSLKFSDHYHELNVLAVRDFYQLPHMNE